MLYLEIYYITFTVINQGLDGIYSRSGLVRIDTVAVPVRSIAIADSSGSINRISVLQLRSPVFSNSQHIISTSINKLFEISVCLKFAWLNLEQITLEAIMVINPCLVNLSISYSGYRHILLSLLVSRTLCRLQVSTDRLVLYRLF